MMSLTSMRHLARRWLKASLLFALLWGSGALAQAALSEAAREALTRGQQAASLALATYDAHFLDRPLWREAITYGIAAQRAAPDRPEPYRFLGQVYTTVKFYSRAWDAWQTYLDLGGQLNAQTNRYVAEVSSWLGVNSFAQNRFQEAIPYFEILRRIDPVGEEANQHLALSYLVLGDPQRARGYLETLNSSYPENRGYAELLAQADEQLRYGVAASNAYRSGLAQVEAGQPADALVSFRQAAQASPDFRDAFVQAGRLSLELGRPQEALGYWQEAAALDPNDREAQQALILARNQSAFGIEAYALYQRGVAQYTGGDALAARSSFEAATRSNPRYGDAWGWLGRIALESGDLAQTLIFYDRARQLVPENALYSSQYEAASQQLAQEEAARLAQEEAARLAEEEALRQAQLEAERRTQEAARLAEEARAQQEAAEAAAQTPPTPEPEAVSEEPAASQAEASPPATAQASTLPEPARATPAPSPTLSVQGGPQTTLLEVAYTHQAEGTSSGGAYSFFAAPAALGGDLETPVNYADGTVYQRLEVLGKPSGEAVQYQLCLVPNDEIVVRPACSTEALSFSGPGVYEARQPLSAFSQYGSIDWSKGLVNVMLVLKDGEGRPLDNTYFAGGADETLDLSRYYPMAVRFEAVIVPPGGVFQGW